ncbi:MAG: bifunctional UDP-N-acetylglucosamine diphosphorylase/glucosamine-1-phosphate N-acetyltransferase GlmU [Pseudomonadota bacterium]
MVVDVIVLAAGLGSRMLSEMPKVLHCIGQAPLIAHVISAVAPLTPRCVIAVVGHGAAAVVKTVSALHADATCIEQGDMLGTGHAVAQALPALPPAVDGAMSKVLVLFGDTPLVRSETLQRMIDSPAAVTVLGFEAVDPTGYGRLIEEDGSLVAIVEHRDAGPAERAVTLCNSGVMCVEAATLRSLVPQIGTDNAKGEYYVTDIVALARKAEQSCAVIRCAEEETLGVNDRAGLATAEAAFQTRKRAEILSAGVTLTAPETVHLALDTVIGPDSVVGPFVVFGPGVTVENGAEILPFSHLEGCHVSQGARIGPHARLRPGAEIGAGARIGNFVEVKEAQIAQGAKINHLSYVGDAQIGEDANIGAGAITCNYDGVMKHRTEIGARAFIGSNSALVAPVRIGDDAMVGSGSVITRDVEAGALAIARGAQTNKPGLARRLMERLRAIKAARR